MSSALPLRVEAEAEAEAHLVPGTLHRFTEQNSHEQKFSMEFKTLDLVVVCPDEMLAVFLRTESDMVQIYPE